MLTKDEIGIIDIFRKDLFGCYTIRDVMKKTGKKTYPWTFDAVMKLSKIGVIKMQTKGKAKLCSINLYNQAALSYLSLLDELEANGKKIPHLDELINDMTTPFFVLLIGGSYASGKETSKSDLDICVIIDDSLKTKPLQNFLANKLMVPRLHPFVFKRKEFLEMLLSKEANYGKLLFKKHLTAFGAKSYYLMMREAIEHGFRD